MLKCQKLQQTNKGNNLTCHSIASTHIPRRPCFGGILRWLAGSWSASPQAAGESFYSLHSLRVFFRIITIRHCIVVMAQLYIYSVTFPLIKCFLKDDYAHLQSFDCSIFWLRKLVILASTKKEMLRNKSFICLLSIS